MGPQGVFIFLISLIFCATIITMGKQQMAKNNLSLNDILPYFLAVVGGLFTAAALGAVIVIHVFNMLQSDPNLLLK